MDLNWLPDDGGTGHMPVNESIIDFWKTIKAKTDFKNMMEIGFNAGHSSSIVLSLFEDVKIDSFDIGQFDITHSNGSIVKDKFKDRFSLSIIDSTQIKSSNVNNKYDLLFIDGGHDYEIVDRDINLFLESDIQYAIIDDLQNRGVKKSFEEHKSKFNVLYKHQYKAILPSWMRNTDRKQVSVNIVLVEKI